MASALPLNNRIAQNAGQTGCNTIFYADFRWYVGEDILIVIVSNQTAHMALFNQSEIVEAVLGEGE